MSVNRLETPVWGPLGEVYEPREDTFLLLDGLEGELSVLRGSTLAVEVGPGSGVVSAALAKALPAAFLLSVDVSPPACLATAHTARLNNVQGSVDVINGDLVSCLNLRNKVDLLVFNPPYVVTEPEEIKGTIERSWAGGRDGTQVINRLIPQVHDLLSEEGVGYFVLIEENHPESIAKELVSQGLSAKIITRKKIPGEKLCVLKFWKGRV